MGTQIKSKIRRNAIYGFMMAVKEYDWKNNYTGLDIDNFMKYYVDNGHEDTMEAIRKDIDFNEYKPKLMEEYY